MKPISPFGSLIPIRLYALARPRKTQSRIMTEIIIMNTFLVMEKSSGKPASVEEDVDRTSFEPGLGEALQGLMEALGADAVHFVAQHRQFVAKRRRIQLRIDPLA